MGDVWIAFFYMYFKWKFSPNQLLGIVQCEGTESEGTEKNVHVVDVIWWKIILFHMVKINSEQLFLIWSVITNQKFTGGMLSKKNWAF